ncbi:MAG: hypothetical protein ACYSW0_11005 [Planctomycetota bacterium]
MEKRIATLAVALVVVGACSSVVLALPPMGPPKAMVGQDQWTVGLGFSHSEMDLQTHGTGREDQGIGFLPAAYDKHQIEDLTSNIVLGSLGFGVSDSWDVFLNVGAADADDEITETLPNGAVGNQYSGLDSSHDFAWGFGTRMTFWRDGDVTWGGLLQILWQNPDGSITLDPGSPLFDPFGGNNKLSGDADLDFWELQIAVGPTLELDNFRVYGGPFLHFVEGDVDIDVTGTDDVPSTWRVISSQEIREESRFGAYAGAQWLVAENTTANVELQFTADAWAFGLGAIWKFQ